MDDSPKIVGRSEPISALRALLTRIADSPATVMVTGESGTGKELVAQFVHRESSRASKAFVPVNCAAIPKDLLESELFGHRKGAFSGAIADRMGRFELAHGGTLFLDEIGDMSLDMQSKLLRVLQEKVVDPIGSTKQISVDVRVVAATHRDLEAECEAGRFREDLYYRLNVLPVRVPALRERASDVQDLVQYFAGRHAVKGTAPVKLDFEFLEVLKGYSWPGNVRELSNLVNRFSALFPGQLLRLRNISPEMLPRKLRELMAQAALNAPVVEAATVSEPDASDASSQPGTSISTSTQQSPLAQPFAAIDIHSGQTLSPAQQAAAASSDMFSALAAQSGGPRSAVEEIIMISQGKQAFPEEGVQLKAHLNTMERDLIRQALQHAGGNITKTAQLLHLQRTTLIQKMTKLRRESDQDEWPVLAASSGGN
jgi:sigma-54 specific flagellar transcriptional regulator A